METRPIVRTRKKGIPIMQIDDTHVLANRSPVVTLSEMLRDTSAKVDMESVCSALENIAHNGNNTISKRTSMEEEKTASNRRLQELLQNAQVLESFTVRKHRKDTHVRDISRKIDAHIKGKVLKLDGTFKEGPKVATGVALVYTNKPDAFPMFMEHEIGSAHDYREFLTHALNGSGHPNSLFSPILPVTFVNGNLKHPSGGLLQGWGCVALVDGDRQSRTTKVTIAILEAEILSPTSVYSGAGKKVSAIDITEQIQAKVSEAIKKSGKTDGHVICCNPHTTVGMIVAKPDAIEHIVTTTEAIGSKNQYYKHNKTAGDDNGRRHLQAEFLGNFFVVPFNNGLIDIGDKRLYAVECDGNITPNKSRERGIITAIF